MDAGPKGWAVLAIVLNLPNTCRRLDERLIAVVIKLWSKVIDRRVLVEIVGRIDGIRAALGRRLAVADIIEVVGITVIGIDCSNGVSQLAAGVIAISDGVIMVEGASRLGHVNATASGIVGVIVLRNDVEPIYD